MHLCECDCCNAYIYTRLTRVAIASYYYSSSAHVPNLITVASYICMNCFECMIPGVAI